MAQSAIAADVAKPVSLPDIAMAGILRSENIRHSRQTRRASRIRTSIRRSCLRHRPW
jgi:hypothetical protein